MDTDIKPIMEQLRFIREELSQIKETMPDKDMFLTAEEKKLLQQSYTNEKEKKLTRSQDLKKELKI
jgi:hypothetical protein